MGLTTIQSGNTTDSELIASFTTLTQYKIQNCIINLPYKSGGYTSVELRIAGVNLLDCRDGTYNGTSHGLTYQTTKDSNNIVLSISVNGTTTQANAFRNLNYASNVRRVLPGKYATHCYSSQMGILVVGSNTSVAPTGYTSYTVANLSNWPHYNVTESWYNNSTATWVRLQAQPYAKNVAIDTVVKPMWCLESYSGCEYEPYTGNNYVVTLPTTIYGGTVDLTQGTVVGTYASDGSELSQNTTASFTPLKLFTKMGINNIWSYQGTVKISYDLVNMNHVSEARRKVIMSQPSLLQIEGQFITTQHAQFAPVTQCGAIITSTQTGSGTPSPDNIRPILGLSSLTLTQSGKNLYNKLTADPQNLKIRNDSGTVVSDGANSYCAGLIPVPSNTPITISGFYDHGNYVAKRVYFLDKNGNWISRTGGYFAPPITVTTPANCYYIQLQLHRFEFESWDNIQIEIGSKASEYEIYKNTITTINWPNQINNVYGGTLDLLTGVLTVTHYSFTYTNSISLRGSSNGNTVYFTPPYEMYHKMNMTAQDGFYCSAFKTNDGIVTGLRTRCGFQQGNTFYNTIYIYGLHDAISSVTSLDTARQYLENLAPQYVYRLLTPQIYQLTPQQLRTFRGVNNISADGTHIYISYWGHPQS